MYLKGVGIACHPPVLIPEVGEGRENEAQKTIRGLRDLALKVAEVKPEVIVCITPHGNVFRDGVAVVYENQMKGDLRNFGHPEINLEKDCDMGLLDELNMSFGKNNCHTIFLNEAIAAEYKIDLNLDHGVLVPLYFIEKYYRTYKIVHITIGELSLIELYKMGKVIKEAIEARGKETMILASADLSHCLKDEGPYAFNPMGPLFDENIVSGIKTKNYYSILTAPHQVYEPAGQCGLRPIVMGLGTIDGWDTEATVFSYEGPFGVGYMSAFIDLTEEKIPSLLERYEEDKVLSYKERRSNESPFVALARAAINTWVQRGRKLNFEHYKNQVEIEADVLGELENNLAGVFVSLHKHGELRGCIGTTGPVTENIAQEIIRNAIEASTYDPRFMPVEEQELMDLEIKVDVLGIPEPVTGVAELDAKKYGVIVEKDLHRGLLLPDLEGVNTPEEQLAIAKRKAGIPEGDTDVMVQRFQVIRHQ
ncbi:MULTISPECIES: AmmeMemoRadiSam system protein A [unclassified Acetobacterium]|jgi:AmmeMemoRadiSam system protein A|uniref:AmmeMemoRadiSam system protein A n=1 Tax=unclassified Acetobacterium TaxID=2638182 RepID=UPI000DBEC5A5|nr:MULTISPECIES: AmmeMemoRadiSam system protein A [unclassified Acetobacterium]AWW27694.1 AMMECR1 domain-containing protein [Acetobacterium sp. KB-1]MDZ5724232.1 AmmeMemoRadiSam system protein A [Acetobacterium sp. K1/6]